MYFFSLALNMLMLGSSTLFTTSLSKFIPKFNYPNKERVLMAINPSRLGLQFIRVISPIASFFTLAKFKMVSKI